MVAIFIFSSVLLVEVSVVMHRVSTVVKGRYRVAAWYGVSVHVSCQSETTTKLLALLRHEVRLQKLANAFLL